MLFKKIEFSAATAFLGLFVYNSFKIAKQIIHLGMQSGMDRPYTQRGVPFDYDPDYARYYLYPDLTVAATIYVGFLILNFVIVPCFLDQRKYLKTAIYTLLVFLGTSAVVFKSDHTRMVLFGHKNPFASSLQRGALEAYYLLLIFVIYTFIKKLIAYYWKRQETLINDIIQKFLIATIIWGVVLTCLIASDQHIFRSFIPIWVSIIPSVFLILIINLYWLMPAYENKQQPIKIYLIKLLVVSFGVYLPFGTVLFTTTHIGLSLFFMIWIAELAFTIPIAWYLYQQNKGRILQLLNLKKELNNTLADLNFLRSQINPHFLFNVLNTLYGTALQENAHRTGEGIQKLGDMMRFMLQENMQEKIALAREVDYLNNYISLQKLRIAASANVTIQTEINEQVNELRIAPMLLIPFVENAFKHGISLGEPSYINISLKIHSNELTFEVSNSNHQQKGIDPEKNNNGIGLANVKQRLQLLYPERHQLVIRESATDFSINLTIDLV